MDVALFPTSLCQMVLLKLVKVVLRVALLLK